MIGPVLFASSEKLVPKLNGHSRQANKNQSLKKSKRSDVVRLKSDEDWNKQIQDQYKQIQHLSVNLGDKLKRKSISYDDYKNLMLLLCEKLKESIYGTK